VRRSRLNSGAPTRMRHHATIAFRKGRPSCLSFFSPSAAPYEIFAKKQKCDASPPSILLTWHCTKRLGRDLLYAVIRLSEARNGYQNFLEKSKIGLGNVTTSPFHSFPLLLYIYEFLFISRDFRVLNARIISSILCSCLH